MPTLRSLFARLAPSRSARLAQPELAPRQPAPTQLVRPDRPPRKRRRLMQRLEEITLYSGSPIPVVQDFLVPLAEADTLNAFQALTPSIPIPASPMESVISIAANRDSTTIVYDHWEDGFESDLSNPAQASTEIWGDGDLTNGVAPGTVNDLINAGDSINLQNPVNVPRNPAEIRFDGGDRFGSTQVLSVSRAIWASGSDTLLAGAVEVYDTTSFGTHFVAPVGQDIDVGRELFEYTGLMVMAAEDNTNVQIDVDGDGSADVSQTLARGQNLHINGGVLSGATVTSDRPVQTHLITGDIDATFESRFYTLVPTAQWSDSYYSPVGSVNDFPDAENAVTQQRDTRVYLFNPNGAAIDVQYAAGDGSSGTIQVGAGATSVFLMPLDSGARFFTNDGSPFTAIAAVDAVDQAGGSGGGPTNTAYDWGFTLVPQANLGTAALVGWGPGSEDLSINASPLWVTVDNDTTLYVDYDGDPSTGALIDPSGDRYDAQVAVSALQSVRVFDNNDNDQTGLRAYTVDGTRVIAAWGQDPDTALGGSPSLDLGTTAAPLTPFFIDKSSALTDDVNGNGLVDAGDTVTYTVTIDNLDFLIPLQNVRLADNLPQYTQYVANTTTVDGAAVPDDSVPPAGSVFPVDESGLAIADIAPLSQSTVQFQVLVTPFPATVTEIANLATVSTNRGERSDIAIFDVNPNSGTLGDVVFFDADGDGDQDAGEPGMSGLTITLEGDIDGDGTFELSDNTTTDGSGQYLFENLPPGIYRVRVTEPAGTVPTRDLNGDTIPDTQNTLTLGLAETKLDQDFGLRGTGGLGDTVFFDANANGVQDAGEPGYGGIGVTLEVDLDGDGTFDFTTATTTDAAGAYAFSNLPAANYRLSIAAPAGTAPSTDLTGDGTPDLANNVTLSAGEVNNDQDFGLVGTGAIGDRVWTDTDGDGSQDAGEPGLSGVAVTMELDLDGDGTYDFTAVATTDVAGSYTFNGLPPANYRIAAAQPAGTSPTADLNADGAPDVRYSLTLAAGESNTSVDFGFDHSAVLGDTVFFDANGNGVQDAGEPGLNGVSVSIQGDTDGDGSFDFNASTTTAADGTYNFARLAPGDYRVSVTPPAGTTPTSDLNGDGTADTKNDVTLAPGETNDRQDFGFLGTGSIGDQLWYDLDGNGAFDPGEPGVAGVQVTLSADLDGDGTIDFTSQTTTDANGQYLFGNLPPGDYAITVEDLDGDGSPDGSSSLTLVAGQANLDQDFGFPGSGVIGDTVFYDANANGIQDAGEPGLSGRTVTLRGDLNGDGVFDFVRSAVTDPVGRYQFNGLPAGDYRATLSAPGLTPTTDFNGDGQPDLLADVSLTPGQTGNTVDFGLIGTGFIGDLVFVDENGNGTPDPSEPGFGGVAVTLSVDLDGDGTIDFTQATVTDPSGGYGFNRLPPGTYTISMTPPSGTSPTTDLNGDTFPDASVTLPLGSGETNDRVDFGLAGNVTVGDLIWNDTNGDGRHDSDEAGIGGLLVTVDIDADGDGVADISAARTTDSSGTYQFSNLPAGNYTIRVAGPVGQSPTFDPDGTLDGQSTLVLAAGQVNLDQDFAFQFFFAFDDFRNHSQPDIIGPADDWGLIHPLPRLTFDPVFSGIADPGTMLVGRIFDAQGNLVGESQVVADAAGNWLMSFPNAVIYEQPHRMVVEQTAAIHNVDESGFNLRRYFHPAVYHSLFFTEQLTISSVLKNAASDVLTSMHQANVEPLRFSWNLHGYEHAVSSTNAAEF